MTWHENDSCDSLNASVGKSNGHQWIPLTEHQWIFIVNLEREVRDDKVRKISKKIYNHSTVHSSSFGVPPLNQSYLLSDQLSTLLDIDEWMHQVFLFDK